MKIIILNTACCWKPHSYPFLHLSKILQQKGYEILQVFENKFECSYKDNNWDKLCQINKIKIENSARENYIPYCFLSDYLEKELRNNVDKMLIKTDSSNWKEQIYDDLNLFSITKGSISRVLRKVIKEPSSQEFEVIQKFYISAICAIEAFKKLYKEVKPDVVIFLNGLWYLERIAYEIGKRFQIRTFAHENSCFNDRKFFDPNGIIANRHSFAFNSLHSLEARVINQSEKLILYEYLQNIYNGNKNTISQTKPGESEIIRKNIRIPNHKKIALLLGQVPYDTVMVYDSPIYDHLIDFIKDTIEFFKIKRDYHLIIRLHPYEEIGNNNATFHSLIKGVIPENISIVHSQQINTYSLMDLCNFGITITSQAGLELLSKNKPLIVLGNAFYANKGFTHDVKDREHYPLVLERVIKNPFLNNDEIIKIEKFLFSMIFEYLIPFDPLVNKFTNNGIDKIIKLLNVCNTYTPSSNFTVDIDNKKKSYNYNNNFIDSWGKFERKSLLIKFYSNKLYYIKKIMSRPIYYMKYLVTIFLKKD